MAAFFELASKLEHPVRRLYGCVSPRIRTRISNHTPRLRPIGKLRTEDVVPVSRESGL